MKKYFFAVTTIVIIFMALYSFSIVPQLTETQMELYNEVDSLGIEELNIETDIEKSIDVHGFLERINYFQCVLVIVLNLVLLEFAGAGSIIRHKKRAIVYSALTILFSLNLLTSLLGLINIIALAAIKRKDEEDFPPKALPIEAGEYVKPSKEDIYRAIDLVLIYIIFHFGVPVILQTLITLDIPKDVFTAIDFISTCIADIIVFICAINIFKKELKEGWNEIKNNTEGYRKYITKYVLIAFVCLFTLNAIRIILTGDEFTSNQDALNNLPLVYVGILAVIWAPIVEETIFRGVLRRFISNKIVFVIVSGLVFGLLHAIGGNQILLNSMPYIGLAVCMTTAYVRSNNIWTDIFMHAINNAVAVVAMYIVFGL